MKNSPTKYPTIPLDSASLCWQPATARTPPPNKTSGRSLARQSLASTISFTRVKPRPATCILCAVKGRLGLPTTPRGKGEISDAQLLSNGNVLFAHQLP